MANAALAPVQQFFNPSTGAFLNGGKIYTYNAGGTVTPKTTYQSQNTAGATYSNPIILSAYGDTTNGIWLSGSYRFVVKDANDNLVRDWDNVSAFDVTSLSANGTFSTDITLQSAKTLIMFNSGNTFKSTITPSAFTANRTITIPDSSIATWVVGTGRVQTSATASLGTTTITNNATAPTTGNTNAINAMFVSYAAQKSSNPIFFHGNVHIGLSSGGADGIICLFKDSTLVGTQLATFAAGKVTNVPFSFALTTGAGDTSAHTYRLYAGAVSWAGGTPGLNTTGTITYGSTITSFMNAFEVSQ